jgi:hypothetical protein
LGCNLEGLTYPATAEGYIVELRDEIYEQNEMFHGEDL